MDEQASLSAEESMDLFGDVTNEDIAEMSVSDAESKPAEAEETEEVKNVSEHQEEQTESKPAEESYTLTHLGKEVKMSRAELLEAAERGLDYGRIRVPYDKVNAMAKSAGQSVEQFLETVGNDLNYGRIIGSYGKMNALAQAAGQSVDEFLSGIEQQAGEIKIAKRVQELVNSGEYSENSARKMAEMEMKLNSQQKMQEQAQAKQSQAEQARKSVGEFIMKNPEFMKEFPNAQLPPEMVQALNSGASISEAWTTYQFNKQTKAMQEMQAELDKYKQFEKNKQSAAPKLQADAANSEKDPFLEGLLGE